MKLFITGTDTEIGKTYVSVGLLKAFQQLGLSTLGVKPIASGCETIEGKLYNQDALALKQASSVQLPYEKINPFAFEPAIAPHIAAREVQCKLSANGIHQQISDTLHYPADITLVEGSGGLHTPLNDHETLADLIRHCNLNVLLVVGMRLGCLNHAILTLRALQRDAIRVVGWVANCIDPLMPYQAENIEALKKHLPAPYLGRAPYDQQNAPLSEIAAMLL